MAEAAEALNEEEPATDSEQLARKWCAEIKAAEKAQKKWVDRGQKIEKIYADERDMNTARARRFNILYSNVETLRPAVYMQTPKAKAVRRYRDRDPVARLARIGRTLAEIAARPLPELKSALRDTCAHNQRHLRDGAEALMGARLRARLARLMRSR